MNRFIIIGLAIGMLVGWGESSWASSPQSRSRAKEQVSTQVVTIKQLQQLLMRELGARIDPQQITLNLQIVFPKTPIVVPAGTLGLSVAQDRFGNLTGRRAFRVQVQVDSQLIKTVSVVASVTARADVITPVRWIKANHVLQANDIVKTRVNLRTLNQDIVMQATDVLGKQATRSLPPNQPVQLSYVTNPPLVHKGDRVMIEVRRGGLFVQTIGIAKATGQSGELIAVTNQGSGREVLATILAPGVVEVRF